MDNYCRYLPITIQGRPCGALIDSGNLWRSVISDRFAKQLGIKKDDLQPLSGIERLGTAKQGSHLKVMGETKAILRLRLQKTGQTFPFRPVVVQGLAMAVNISGPWLKANGWDHLHSQDCLSIGGTKIPLAKKEVALPINGNVYALGRVAIKAHSISTVQVIAPAIQADQVRPGGGCFEADESLATDGLYSALHALVEADSEGRFSIQVMNPTPIDTTISGGTKIGVFTSSTEDEEAWGKNEDLICVLPGPVTRQSRKEDYINNFVRTAKEAATIEGPKKEKAADFASFTQVQRKEWIRNTFQLADKPCLQDARDLKAAVDVLEEFWDLFSHDGSYGHTHLLKHRIITEDVPPIKCRYRPLNPALEPDLRRQLDEWLKHDVIEAANSPWSFNLVAAKKKGGKVRWCIDWRRLNDITKKDSWPMPTVQDTIARLAGSTIYSGVDMAGAFHCIDLDERDREKTAFATPFGSFQQKRLGFGVTNGPATYCRLVDRVLKDIPDTVAISFLDDGVIHSTTVDQHLENVRRTLTAYREAGLRLAPHKCSFFSQEIIYLGHVLDRNGIRPTDSYIDAVRKWDLPRYKTEARAFLGVTGYYRQHIKDYAKLARAWTDVIGKTDHEAEKTALKLTPDMIDSFKNLKTALITAPVLGFP